MAKGFAAAAASLEEESMATEVLLRAAVANTGHAIEEEAVCTLWRYYLLLCKSHSRSEPSATSPEGPLALYGTLQLSPPGHPASPAATSAATATAAAQTQGYHAVAWTLPSATPQLLQQCPQL